MARFSQSIPKTMHAMLLTGHGGMERYRWVQDYPVPQIEAHEVLLQVGACGLNNTDVNTRSGWYSRATEGATTGEACLAPDAGDAPSWGGRALQFPRIQGADVVGQVVGVGANADTKLLGKRVLVDCWLRDWDSAAGKDGVGYFGSECDGGFAQYTRVDARNVRAVESPLSDAELATFSCSYTTAEGMLRRAEVTREDCVLVTGASGGVGGAVVQLAKRRGARVVALAAEAKHAQVAKLQPDLLLPRAPEDLRAALGDEKISVVADIVGGDYWQNLIDILERGGRYTCSGAIAGAVVRFDLRPFYLRDLTFTGSTVVPPQVFTDLVAYIERGEVAPLLAATYPLRELCAAQQAFIDKRHTGNIVVLP